MSLYFRHRTNLYTDRLTVLHFAPEVAFREHLASRPNLRYISADLCSPRAQVRFDICRIPFPDKSIDVILCSHVLEHVPDDRKAMSELFRVMKPGGWGLIQVPMDRTREESLEDERIVSPEERERVFGQRDHVRLYGLDYYDRLRSAGFSVHLDPYAKGLPRDVITKHNLPERLVICLCTRPDAEAG